MSAETTTLARFVAERLPILIKRTAYDTSDQRSPRNRAPGGTTVTNLMEFSHLNLLPVVRDIRKRVTRKSHKAFGRHGLGRVRKLSISFRDMIQKIENLVVVVE